MMLYKKLFYTYLFLLLTVSPQFSFSQQPYYPDTIWQTRTAAQLNINGTMLDSAASFATRNETTTDYDLRIANLKAYANEPGFKLAGPTRFRGKPAGIILYKGYIVARWGDVERVDMTFSVTKSFLSAVTGLAIDKHLIKNVDDRVSQYVWDDTFAGEHNAKISWKHLLTQSSDWSGCLFDVCDWADRPPKEGGIDDWKNRKLIEPGQQFEYNDVRVNLLAYSLLQVWRKPLPVVLKEGIMDKIGASTTWRWYGYDNSFVNMDGVMVQSVSGGGHFGGGLFISTLDQARFGLLFLRNGKWNNQQILSSDWIKASQQPSFANKNYGYMWWLNQGNTLKGLSKNIYYADGFGGNKIVIDEEHDLVVVARWLDNSKIGELVSIAIKAVEKKISNEK